MFKTHFTSSSIVIVRQFVSLFKLFIKNRIEFDRRSTETNKVFHFQFHCFNKHMNACFVDRTHTHTHHCFDALNMRAVYNCYIVIKTIEMNRIESNLFAIWSNKRWQCLRTFNTYTEQYNGTSDLRRNKTSGRLFLKKSDTLNKIKSNSSSSSSIGNKSNIVISIKQLIHIHTQTQIQERI